MKGTYKKAIASAFMALLCLGALSLAQDVKYNFVPGTDFSKYKTYKWITIEGGAHPDQILDGQIKQAIETELASKGLTKTTDDKADLGVGYQVAIDQQKQWNAYGGGRGVRMGGTASATSSTINIGTLVVDFYDTAQKTQIWRGDATKTLNPSKDPQKNLTNLQKAVAKLLKNFPPPAKK